MGRGRGWRLGRSVTCVSNYINKSRQETSRCRRHHVIARRCHVSRTRWGRNRGAALHRRRLVVTLLYHRDTSGSWTNGRRTGDSPWRQGFLSAARTRRLPRCPRPPACAACSTPLPSPSSWRRTTGSPPRSWKRPGSRASGPRASRCRPRSACATTTRPPGPRSSKCWSSWPTPLRSPSSWMATPATATSTTCGAW